MKNYELLNQISNHKSVCLIGHTSPDADALASMVVFKNFLSKNFNLEIIDLFAECSKIPYQYAHMMMNNSINQPIKNYDVAIMMDSPNTERLGIYKTLFNESNLKIVIDHHQTNLYQGDINIVEKQGSTCEIVYQILKTFNYQLTQLDKELIYSGIITDTNNFTVGNFNSKTFSIVSEFFNDIDYESIYNQFFRNNSLKNMQLLATAIDNISVYNEEQIVISHLTKDEKLKLNAKFDDFVGIINRLATINNCKLICFIYPKGDNYYVSMRSRHGLKISHIAKNNGGGGHDGAAAFVSSLSIDEIEKLILEEFQKLL